MKYIALSAVYLTATTVIADVIPIDGGMYVVTDTGPVLGPTIVRVYSEATDFCTKQRREVATVNLQQTDRDVRQMASATLKFQCVSALSSCVHLLPEGARVDADNGELIMKDGTVKHYEPCSDAEKTREPPPP